VEKRLRKVVAERKNCHNTLKGGSWSWSFVVGIVIFCLLFCRDKNLRGILWELESDKMGGRSSGPLCDGGGRK
jgi:hypothetical protein